MIVPEDPAKAPGMDTIEPRQTDDFDGAKRGPLAAHGLLVLTVNDQRHGMKPCQGLAMGIPNKSAMSPVRVATRELAAGCVA